MHNLKGERSKPESLASIVKRLGHPESTTLLHSSCHVFQIPQVDGAIGYHRSRDCAIVVGDPICLPQDIETLTQAFHFHCQESKLKTVYLSAYHDFAHWAINNGCRTLVQVGSELSINPTHFQKKHKLRWAINQSIQYGVDVKEYKDVDPALEDQMKQAISTWLQQRSGPQIHLGKMNFFNSAIEKRIFYAQQKDKIVGLLMLTPVDRYQGWVLSFYLAILTLQSAHRNT